MILKNKHVYFCFIVGGVIFFLLIKIQKRLNIRSNKKTSLVHI